MGNLCHLGKEESCCHSNNWLYFDLPAWRKPILLWRKVYISTWPVNRTRDKLKMLDWFIFKCWNRRFKYWRVTVGFLHFILFRKLKRPMIKVFCREVNLTFHFSPNLPFINSMKLIFRFLSYLSQILLNFRKFPPSAKNVSLFWHLIVCVRVERRDRTNPRVTAWKQNSSQRMKSLTLAPGLTSAKLWSYTVKAVAAEGWKYITDFINITRITHPNHQLW